MKVIHVLNHFLPHQTAGTEVYVWALCKQLQKLDCNVSVLIPHYESLVSEKYSYDGIEVFKYAEPSKPDRALTTEQKKPEGLKNFTQYIKEQKPDVAHFHEIAGSTGIGIAHIEAAKTTGVKVVFTMHLANNTCNTGTLMYKGETLCDGVIREIQCTRCSLVKKTDSSFKTAFLLYPSVFLYTLGINTLSWQNAAGTALSFPFQIKQLKNKLKRIETACDKIVPITGWYHKILLRNGLAANKMKVITQALPTSVSPAVPPDREIKLPLRLIFIGRIDALKGIPLLIDAVKGFTAAEIQLDIYGNSPDAGFVQQCKDLTASCSHIRWMGELKQEEVVPSIRGYDALVLPSMFSEMSPLVIQEAYAAGVPVIGSNVYGIAEQVKEGATGWLFQFNDAVSLQRLLLRLVQDPGLMNVVKKNIPIPSSFDKVALAYKYIYNEIIAA